jgi:hypothetical protein
MPRGEAPLPGAVGPNSLTWISVALGGVRGSDSFYWVILDQIATALTYVADEDMLAGLSWNASPPQVLDGIAVRTAVGTASTNTS